MEPEKNIPKPSQLQDARTAEAVSHTPWELDRKDMRVRNQAGEVVAIVIAHPAVSANARLIAAAPDLLAACKAALPIILFDPTNDDDMAAIELLNSAIAKALPEPAP